MTTTRPTRVYPNESRLTHAHEALRAWRDRTKRIPWAQQLAARKLAEVHAKLILTKDPGMPDAP